MISFILFRCKHQSKSIPIVKLYYFGIVYSINYEISTGDL